MRDDAPNVPGPTAPWIALDATGRGARWGQLEVRADRDAFQFAITTAGVYQFDQVGSSLADSFLRLYGGNRVELASADNGAGKLNSRIVRAMTPGTYYLVAGSKADRLTGAYTLTVSRCLPPNQAPTVAAAAGAGESVIVGIGTTLSVLGADDGGEANLRYTWSATSVPTGVAGPRFSVNGVNAAKNTAVTFAGAGAYRLTVAIADAAGLVATSAVDVLVNQTMTSVVVSPGSANLRTGTTKQFVASARDQFNRDMAVQSGFSWTATIGTADANGLLQASLAAGSGQITATAGQFSGSAGVTITAFQNPLLDPELANLFGTLYADLAITRGDMVQLLRAAGSDNGVVDATELADLRHLVGNAVSYAIPDYVRNLAGDIVNGNRANAAFQGRTLGNLAAGSSAAQLNQLVDKWFFGTDRPAAPYAYQFFAGSLFVNGPAYDDSDQGYLGDCYFLAALDAIAAGSPAAIQNMFVDNGDNTWTVRFFANGVADYVSVDRYLPSYYGTTIYASVGGSYASSGNELWMALAEKAYAQWNETGNAGRDGRNSYASLAGGWMQTVSEQVLGRAARSYWGLPDSDKQVLVAALNAKKAVTYGTKSNPGNGMVGPHAYMITRYDAATDRFLLYNPWGSTHPAPLSYAQLRVSGQCFVVADPAGSVPIDVRAQELRCQVHVATFDLVPSRVRVTDECVVAVARRADSSAPGPNEGVWGRLAVDDAGRQLADMVTRDMARHLPEHDTGTSDDLFATVDFLGELLCEATG